MGNILNLIKKGFSSPFEAIEYILSLLRGYLLVRYWNATGRKVIVGRKFKVSGRVAVKGPGTIVLGDNVLLTGTMNSVCTLFTSATDARIEIGSNTVLNGSRFGCMQRIAIGEGCLIGDARIADNDGHSIRKDRRSVSGSELTAKPVLLADNVWIGAGVFILKGVKIGKNSVVGSGAVVIGNIPENAYALGNPARVMGALPGEM